MTSGLSGIRSDSPDARPPLLRAVATAVCDMCARPAV